MGNIIQNQYLDEQTELLVEVQHEHINLIDLYVQVVNILTLMI